MKRYFLYIILGVCILLSIILATKLHINLPQKLSRFFIKESLPESNEDIFPVKLSYDFRNDYGLFDSNKWKRVHHPGNNPQTTYDFSMNLPPGWEFVDIPEYEGEPVVLLVKNDSQLSNNGVFRSIPQMTFGFVDFFSTSGALCANSACDGGGFITLDLSGKKQELEFVKRTYRTESEDWDAGRPFYVFEIYYKNLLGKKVIDGSYPLENPLITVWFDKLSDLDQMVEMLRSIQV